VWSDLIILEEIPASGGWTKALKWLLGFWGGGYAHPRHFAVCGRASPPTVTHPLSPTNSHLSPTVTRGKQCWTSRSSSSIFQIFRCAANNLLFWLCVQQK
jgi:hypothetical protein